MEACLRLHGAATAREAESRQLHLRWSIHQRKLNYHQRNSTHSESQAVDAGSGASGAMLPTGAPAGWCCLPLRLTARPWHGARQARRADTVTELAALFPLLLLTTAFPYTTPRGSHTARARLGWVGLGLVCLQGKPPGYQPRAHRTPVPAAPPPGPAARGQLETSPACTGTDPRISRTPTGTESSRLGQAGPGGLGRADAGDGNQHSPSSSSFRSRRTSRLSRRNCRSVSALMRCDSFSSAEEQQPAIAPRLWHAGERRKAAPAPPHRWEGLPPPLPAPEGPGIGTGPCHCPPWLMIAGAAGPVLWRGGNDPPPAAHGAGVGQTLGRRAPDRRRGTPGRRQRIGANGSRLLKKKKTENPRRHRNPPQITPPPANRHTPVGGS